jgi:hypothetical protein
MIYASPRDRKYMRGSIGFWVIVGLLALIAIFKGQFWGLLSLLIGTFIGFSIGLNFDDDIASILAICLVVYLVGKFIVKKITEHNLRYQ